MIITPTETQLADARASADAGVLGNFSLPGTGKTITNLETYKAGGYQGGLIIAPSIALDMWANNIEQHLGAKVRVYADSKRTPDPKVDFHVTTYDLMYRDMGRKLTNYFSVNAGKWGLTIDESHYCKGIDTKRAHHIWGDVLNDTGGITQYFDGVWPMTGTPIRGCHDDLYPMLRTLWPEILYDYDCLTYRDFLRAFTYQDYVQYPGMRTPQLRVLRSTNEYIINKMLYKDIGMIRRKRDKDLPSLTTRNWLIKLDNPSWVDVPKDLVSMLHKLSESQAIYMLEGNKKSDNLARMRRIMGLLAIKNSIDFIVDACAAGPVLIGVVHTDVSKVLHDKLRACDLSGEVLDGSTSRTKRLSIEKRFNHCEIDYIIGQVEACSTAINLQKASNRVIILEDDFRPDIIEQFYSRVWRRGQANACTLDFLVPKCGLGRAIPAVRQRKSASHKKTLDEVV